MFSESYINRIKELGGILNELTSEEIYKKYYADKVNQGNFIQIVSSDPTSIVEGDNIKKMGNYSKWLLNLFIKHKLKLEDLYKVTEYFTFVEKNKNILREKGIVLDVNKYKNLPDLFAAIQPLMKKKNIKPPTEIKSEQDLLDNDYFVENKEVEVHDLGNDWTVFMPKTFKASQFYGHDSEWCTTKPDMYEHYTRQGILYIFINKNKINSQDPGRRVQVHLEAGQFMDMNDGEVDKRDFLNDNPEILNFLFNQMKPSLEQDKSEYRIIDGKYYMVKNGWGDFSEKFKSGRDISEEFIKAVLSSDAWEYFDNQINADLADACGYINEENILDIQKILVKRFPDKNFEEYGSDLDDVLSGLENEGEDVEDIIDAIKHAMSNAQQSADESEAYDMLTKAIISHYSIKSYDWKDDKLFVEVPESEFKMAVMGVADEDDEINYSPPYYGYSGDVDKGHYNEELDNKLCDIKEYKQLAENTLRRFVRNILEDYRFEYNKEHTPTDTMSSIAKKAKEVSEKNNLIAQYKSGGGVVTGEKRSKKIISKTPFTHHEVRALRDLFTSIEAEVNQARAKGLNVTNSAVIQIWELNGGEAGKTWANGILGSHHTKSLNHKENRRGFDGIGLHKNLMKARLPRKQN